MIRSLAGRAATLRVNHGHWFTLPRSMGWRRAVGEWCRWVGDRIGPEDAVCPTGHRMVLVPGHGWKLGEAFGPGVTVNIRRSDYKVHAWDGWEASR